MRLGRTGQVGIHICLAKRGSAQLTFVAVSIFFLLFPKSCVVFFYTFVLPFAVCPLRRTLLAMTARVPCYVCWFDAPLLLTHIHFPSYLIQSD
jgi:hypothetical protein